MKLKDALIRIDHLEKALDRMEVQLHQREVKLKVVERQMSELESVIIKARNALSPRGMIKLSSEQEPTINENN